MSRPRLPRLLAHLGAAGSVMSWTAVSALAACDHGASPPSAAPAASATAPYGAPQSYGPPVSSVGPLEGTPAPRIAAPQAGGMQPLAPVRASDPAAVARLVAAAGGAPLATTEPAQDATGDGVASGLKRVAAKNAIGMKADGPMAVGKLAEGGHLAFMVTFAPDKCYTVVGFAAPGTVKDLDLNLLAPPLFNALAGQDESDDNAPVIGKGGVMCPANSLELQYKVDIVAHAGAGNVGVQVYSKAK